MASRLPLVDIERLREGVHIELELGWADHPFPFSAFTLRSAEQIATLRALGLRQVRYSPQRSRVQPLPAAPPLPAASAAAAAPAAWQHARDQRRLQLDAQQRSLQRAERAYDEAARQLRSLQGLSRGQPAQAAAGAEALADQLLGELRGEREVAIRLLSERAGDESAQHAVNVAVLSLLLGRTVGLGPAALRDLLLGALLHDIGKLALPPRLRFVSEQLSPSERRIAQEHVAHGVEMGRQMGLGSAVLAIIGEHHERADGSGYPERRRGPQLSPAARVVALVNHYDNLCNPPNLLQALTPHEALAQIYSRQQAGFDGPTLALFVRMMGIYPPGSVLQLSDGRYALSVAVNPSNPRRPQVVVHDPRVPPEQSVVVDLDAEPGLEVERSLKPVALPRAVFEYLSPRRRTSYFVEALPRG
jgi:putative nucleotidyltransferase with HDIG domain